MLSIQNGLTGDSVPTILIPGRHFLKEGRLMKVCVSMYCLCCVCMYCVHVFSPSQVCRRRPKERVVYLFSDILIYGRPNMLGPVEWVSLIPGPDNNTYMYTPLSRSYEYRGILHLANGSVEVEQSSPVAPGVNVLFRVSDPNTSLLFFCHKEQEVCQWVEAIRSAIM